MSVRAKLLASAALWLLGLELISGIAYAYDLRISDTLNTHAALENTAICTRSAQSHGYFYDRLRADIELQHVKYPALLAKLVLDNTSDYLSRAESFHNDSSIYRGYIQIRGAKHLWSLGKQRIPLGVGRVWNPIDIFNPIDTQQIEPDERAGTESLRYEYAFNQLSNLEATIAKDQAALRMKGYLNRADVALVGLWDEHNDQDILGWELEGQLLGSGIELRSEGGSFGDHDSDERFTRFILGAEYGFTNSLNLLMEYQFNDGSADDYLALMASFQPRILWSCRLLLLTNLADASYFVSPALEYSLSDEMTLSAGAFLYSCSGGEFSSLSNRYYVSWFVHF